MVAVESRINRGATATVGSEARPVRLLTVTTLFPNACQPSHGIFVATRLRKLCDSGRVTAHVVAPLPWFPGVYRAVDRAPRSETVAGFDVQHPRYLNIPKVGMRAQPDLLAMALLRHLDRHRGVGREIDAVDAHYFYPDGVAAARVAEALGVPLIITARGSDINLIGDFPFARYRMVAVANKADGLIAVSRALAQRMTALGMPGDRLHVLRNGVDTELFRPFDRTQARRRLGLQDGRWVLAVGNLVPEKRFDLLIRAMPALPDVRLLVIGDGPLRRELRSLAASVAAGRVEFRDKLPQPELRFAYAACDVLGLPSQREGWPNVVLESIASGTPVAAAAVGGVPEILGPQAPGILVDAASEDWAPPLRTLLEACMGQDGVRAYALKFGWDEVVARQCDLYESVVARRTSRPRRPGGQARAADAAG